MTSQIARHEKQLGAILRRARRQADLTQETLGSQIHLRQATVSRLEAGVSGAGQYVDGRSLGPGP